MAASYQDLPHRIGDPEYDSDMSEIENFIAALNAPGDPLKQQIVHDYYKSKLLSYWVNLKEYNLSGDILRDRTKYSAGLTKSTVLIGKTAQEIEDMEQEVLQTLQEKDHYFMQGRKVNGKGFLQEFRRLSKWGCVNDPEVESGYERPITAHDWALPNDVGLFGLNSYLHAIFNGIYLIGIPIRVTSFDARIACAFSFIEHDIAHGYSIRHFYKQFSPESWSSWRRAYYTVVGDQELSIEDKRAFILIIWVSIHEIQARAPSMHSTSANKAISEIVSASIGRDIDNVDAMLIEAWNQVGSKEIVDSFKSAFGKASIDERRLTFLSSSRPYKPFLARFAQVDQPLGGDTAYALLSWKLWVWLQEKKA